MFQPLHKLREGVAHSSTPTQFARRKRRDPQSDLLSLNLLAPSKTRSRRSPSLQTRASSHRMLQRISSSPRSSSLSHQIFHVARCPWLYRPLHSDRVRLPHLPRLARSSSAAASSRHHLQSAWSHYANQVRHQLVTPTCLSRPFHAQHPSAAPITTSMSSDGAALTGSAANSALTKASLAHHRPARDARQSRLLLHVTSSCGVKLRSTQMSRISSRSNPTPCKTRAASMRDANASACRSRHKKTPTSLHDPVARCFMLTSGRIPAIYSC